MDPIIQRIDYIGSKYTLLSWIEKTILDRTQWASLENHSLADLFAGTGVVSNYFRSKGCTVTSNDAELYSSTIAYALTISVYTPRLQELLEAGNALLQQNAHGLVEGFITKNYSPYQGNARMFFTVDNAKRIDFLRQWIEEQRDLTQAEYKFLVASLLVSADRVSNVPAVYGCYLKHFKKKALTPLVFSAVHTISTPAAQQNAVFHRNTLDPMFLQGIHAEAVYLDPPYNGRQYSKNYFPLNMIAMSPQEAQTQVLKGKTGIPEGSFVSPLCQVSQVEDAFHTIFANLRCPWIFLSYNSESLIPKDKMITLLGKYGAVTVEERDYKRFKSFQYNQDVAIQEYLFCVAR